MTNTDDILGGARLDVRVDDIGATVLALAGRLDNASAGNLWDAALRALPGSGTVTLDAGGIVYCDGAGISLLHDMVRQQRQGGGRLLIRGLRPEIQSFLDLSDPDDELRPELDEARCLSLPEKVGTSTVEILADLRAMITFLGQVVAALGLVALRPTRVRWQEVCVRCTTAGAFALPVVALIGFLLGWVLAFSAAFILQAYGAADRLGWLIGPAMVRELGPLMTCVVLAARSGSAFAAEIGTMKINEEVDALTTMALDPVRFLVTPKVLAIVLMTPLLTAFAMLAGIVGGGVVSVFVLDQPPIVYLNRMLDFVDLTSVLIGLSKSIIFGFIVALIGCFRGLQTALDPTAVGASTTSSVVTSIVFLAVADAILAVLVQQAGI